MQIQVFFQSNERGHRPMLRLFGEAAQADVIVL